MRFLHLSTCGLAHSSFANCSSYLSFEGCCFQISTCLIRFRSGLIAGSPEFTFQPILGVVRCVFWDTVLLEEQWLLKETQLCDTEYNLALQNTLVISRFHASMHIFKGTPKSVSHLHVWLSVLFFWKQSLCSGPKNNILFLICWLNILPVRYWLVVMLGQTPAWAFLSLSAVVSSLVSCHRTSFHWVGDGWCEFRR